MADLALSDRFASDWLMPAMLQARQEQKIGHTTIPETFCAQRVPLNIAVVCAAALCCLLQLHQCPELCNEK